MKRLFVSDLHLGRQDSKYKEFLKILLTDKYDELYLVGDVFDLWIKDFEYIRNKCCDFFVTLEDLILRQRLKVIYVIGNHDSEIDIDNDELLKKIDVTISVEVDKKMRIFHGHQYDFLMKKYFFFFKVFTWLFSLFNATYESSFSDKKNKLNFKKLLEDVRNHAIQDNPNENIIIMGHTHIPEDVTIQGVRYINLGDWVTHSTYVVETDGIIELKGN